MQAFLLYLYVMKLIIILLLTLTQGTKPDDKACPPGHIWKYNEYDHKWKCEAERALPVELIYFKGGQVGNQVQLAWSTAMEKNNAFYDVQGSEDGKVFSSLTRIDSHASNSASQQFYRIFTEPRKYYRLKQVDIDGTEQYYHIIYVPFKRIETPLIKYNVIGQQIRP